MGFVLHHRLAADTVPIGVLPLSQVLLMNDCNFPWCILVPRREAIREIHALPPDDQLQLFREISAVSAAMEPAFAAFKMNVAALGNAVPQLHVHVIARFETDPAWPAPVWGKIPAKKYSIIEQKQQLMRFRTAFNPIPGFRTTL